MEVSKKLSIVSSTKSKQDYQPKKLIVSTKNQFIDVGAFEGLRATKSDDSDNSPHFSKHDETKFSFEEEKDTKMGKHRF